MKRTSCRQWLGVFLIILGAIWALKNFNVFTPEFEYLYLSWPMFMMVMGVLFIFRFKGGFFSFLLVLIGAAFFLSRLYGRPVGDIFTDFWPLMLIALGISIMFDQWHDRGKRNKRIEKRNEERSEDVIDISSFLTEDKIDITSQQLSRVKASTVLASSKINLYQANPAKGCIINMEIMLGGVEMYIPSHWRVKNNISTLFGGVDDKRRRSVPLEGEEQPEITLEGTVLFGGLEIKS